MLQKLGLKEGEAIIHPWINKALEKAQKKVEARNFDIRKNLLKYDDVMNDQRKVVFEQRKELMDGTGLSDTVEEMRREVVEGIVTKHIPEKAYAEQWDVNGLKEETVRLLNIDVPVDEWAREEGIAEDDILERLMDAANKAAAERAERFGPEITEYVEKSIVLQTLDTLWREHLMSLDHLRSVIGFRGYAQRDPLQEYKQESFELFQAMLANLRQAVTAQLMRVEIVREQAEAPPPEMPEWRRITPTRRPARTSFPRSRRLPITALRSGRDKSPPRIAIRTIRRPGARSGATRHVPAARARNTSTATAPS